MNESMYFIFAIIPFLLIFLFMIILRWSALHSMPAVFVATAAISFLVWQMSLSTLFISFVKGILVVIEILLIVFFAILLLIIFKHSRKIEVIEHFLLTISTDARIQAVILGWSFVCLIEGASGFGTPAALVAPLLLYLGFNPITAVVIPLIGDSAPVTFGAVGTPINIGLGTLGFDKIVLEKVTLYSAIFHSILSIIVPLFIVYFVIKTYGKKFKDFKECIPFCIISWLSFSIPYLLTAYLFGPELPSIIGGASSLIITCYFAKKNLFVPKNKILLKKVRLKKVNFKHVIVAFLPYLFLVLSLVSIRAIKPLFNFLSQIYISIPEFLGHSFNYKLYPFISPAFYFFMTCIFTLIIFRQKFNEICIECDLAAIRLKTAAISLLFTLGIVQIFIFSSINQSGLESMPVIIANFLSQTFSHYYFVISPFIGALGSFIAGSNTVSNLLFGTLQAQTATKLGVSFIGALVLQTVGGAIGNMIAIHNILASSATIGLKGHEGNILRKTIKPAIVYCLLAGIFGFIAFVVFRIA